jgi:hypothetical protein
MKKISLLLLPLLLIACKKNVVITDIVIDPNPPSTADTIKCIALTKSMTNKGSFDWKITAESGQEVEIIESKNNLLQWRTDYTGFYTVEVKHGSGKNSSSYSEVIEVSNNTPNYYKTAFVGKWSGVGDTPAAWVPNFINLDIEFFLDGTYSAQGTNATYCPAFYYGDDEDNPGKKYTITDVNENGAVGTLVIYYSGPSGGTLFTDMIEEINFSNLNQTVQFNYYRTSTGSSYGPIKYTLDRVE